MIERCDPIWLWLALAPACVAGNYIDFKMEGT
jgi:hypothetical protein